MAGAVRAFLRTVFQPMPRLDPQRARNLPVPADAQKLVAELMREGRILMAIKEIRTATLYDFRDARDAAFAIHYGVEVPTRPAPEHS
ncbi:hypothetical protein [Streptacidiphilus rugosus]|uniref:hypothetical protein n=1 Tax=Streptacidiphilus rugosus TaxID=405783 RepID=UPI00055ED5C6|nr:hypothetical protein [Streptacidiphilus rugosus]